jgi:glycosyltransferase involved in cell wall biosynthesis
MGVDLRLLHETNPQKYFPALYFLAERGSVRMRGEHRYSVAKEWLRAGLRDRTPIGTRTANAWRDLMFRLSVWQVRDETVVIGFAPWDWRILLYRGLASRNRILYQTSWHDWRIDRTPRQPRPRVLKLALRRAWLGFLKHPNVRCIAVTPVAARSMLDETGVHATVIPHAVPAVFFEAGKSRQMRPEGTLRLLYVGEVSEKKGIPVLLGLLSDLRGSDVTLTVVGNGTLAQSIKVAGPNVTFLGPIRDRGQMADIMAAHDVLVVLSQRTKTWEELFGIVIVEALATGLAVIASDHIGPHGILESTGSAGLYDETDLNGILNTLQEMIADRAVIEALRLRQATAADAYQIDRVAAIWMSQIEEAQQ